MRDILPTGRPLLLLAPMQDVTRLPLLRVMARRGGPDVFVTEYFRVHPKSRLDPGLLRLIAERPGQRPVIAQLIGSEPIALARAARQLSEHPVTAIDLNLGCPAPVVCRKQAGGGMLRDLRLLDQVLTEMRAAIPGRFTVKTRVGHDSPDEFPALLEILARHRLDAVTVHARTVREGYATAVHPECVRLAVNVLNCPVIANGNIVDVATAQAFLARTDAAGLMIGRGAIRNPWIFAQLQAAFENQPPPRPTRRDLLDWLLELHGEAASEAPRHDPSKLVHALKKTLLFATQGMEPEFEHDLRRVADEASFRAVCLRFLDRDDPLPDRPPLTSAMFRGFGDLA